MKYGFLSPRDTAYDSYVSRLARYFRPDEHFVPAATFDGARRRSAGTTCVDTSGPSAFAFRRRQPVEPLAVCGGRPIGALGADP
jgi:hypothetical protein